MKLNKMNTKTLLMLSALALGLIPLTALAQAEGAMSGMEMPQKPTPSPLLVTATITPNPPRTGDNALDLLISSAAGKPETGLKLMGSVAMTSMDMGTTHPAFTEAGGGHYKATVTFGMDGPWRVVVQARGSKLAVLNFAPGSKTPWKAPQSKMAAAASTSPPPTANTMGGMDNGKSASIAGMDMSSKMVASPDATKKGAAGTSPATKPSGTSDMNMADMNTMPGMGSNKGGMSGMTTGIADMKTATVPQLQEKGTYTATGSEDWKKQTGFGHNAAMVGMMNQMMVGGSGMEGMKMPPMNMKFDAQNYAKPEGGETSGAGDMAGMDMSGKDSGMKMDTPAPASSAPVAPVTPSNPVAPIPTPVAPAATQPPSGVAPSTITATINAPKAGDNTLQISVSSAQGQPVTGAKIATSVAMTSMDMGTSNPAVKEMGNGQYQATVNFGMAGPWRVKVKVMLPGQKPVFKAFDFTAK